MMLLLNTNNNTIVENNITTHINIDSNLPSKSLVSSSTSSSSVIADISLQEHHKEFLKHETSSSPSSSIGNNNYHSNLLTPDKSNVFDTNNSTNNTIINNNNTNNNSLWFELPKMDNFLDLFSICCSTAVIFGGLVPYIPQYLKIKQSLNSDGFSTYVCLTLLIANILRILFWFGHRFELPLLFQSFVMIGGMLAMMEICVRTREKSPSLTISSIIGNQRVRRRFRIGGQDQNFGFPTHSSYQHSLSLNGDHEGGSRVMYTNTITSVSYPGATTEHNQQQKTASPVSLNDEPELVSIEQSESQPTVQHSNSASTTPNRFYFFKCFNFRYFWDWDDIFSYIEFLSLFTIIVSILTYLLKDNYLYVESLGFIAVFTESMLGMPQLFRNYLKKSTRGMSVEMVAMWLSGDLFKTLYFIIKKAPIQFPICGTIQVIVDILIIGQVLWYRRPNVTYRKLPKSG